MKHSGVYKLEGVLQHYQWGGTHFLPTLLQKSNEEKLPWAEYWLGVHPKGTAKVSTEQGLVALSDFLQQQPRFLGEEVQRQFGELPFLFKILDVKKMLSIQLHPTREAAQKGFALEEQTGIPRLDPQRSYKDSNHKPEVMVALTDFWLLHGFKKEQSVTQTLQKVPQWQVLLPILEANGVPGLYEHVMKASDREVFALLNPLYENLRVKQEELTPDTPDYWAWQAFQQYSTAVQHDRGVFSIYWFNLVFLSPGEGIFQGAGIPHAYLRGVNVELMANSDNVLRGGLTPKHIDVTELLANIDFTPVDPQILKGKPISKVCTDYPVPVPDFALRKYELASAQAWEYQQNGPGIYVILEGEVSINEQEFVQGQACLITDGISVKFKNKDNVTTTIFAAAV